MSVYVSICFAYVCVFYAHTRVRIVIEKTNRKLGNEATAESHQLSLPKQFQCDTHSISYTGREEVACLKI